jgi:glycine/D-amino acid oxidase-like deaminating enzyme
MDGHVNPLYLLRALHAAFAGAGGRLENGAPVERIEPGTQGFSITRTDGSWHAGNVVLCAGLGNARLAPMVGMEAPVVPNRGQVLVTERVRPFLPLPTVQVRQVGEGALQIGDSHEDVGLDDGTRGDVVAWIARRAVRLFPCLAQVRVVRAWGALRVMTPDEHPVYDRGPNAAVVNGHSGVTLAAAHARVLAGWIAGDTDTDIPEFMEVFSAARFRLPAA